MGKKAKSVTVVLFDYHISSTCRSPVDFREDSGRKTFYTTESLPVFCGGRSGW